MLYCKTRLLKPWKPESGTECSFKEQTASHNKGMVFPAAPSGVRACFRHSFAYFQRTTLLSKQVWHLSLLRQNKATWQDRGWKCPRPSSCSKQGQLRGHIRLPRASTCPVLQTSQERCPSPPGNPLHCWTALIVFLIFSPKPLISTYTLCLSSSRHSLQ